MRQPIVVRGRFPIPIKEAVLIPLEGTLRFQRQRVRQQVMFKPRAVAMEAMQIDIPDHPASSVGWYGTQPASVVASGGCKFICVTGRTASGTGSSGTCNLDSNYIAKNSGTGTAGGVTESATTLANGAQKCLVAQGIRQVPEDVTSGEPDACVNPAKGYFSADGTKTPCGGVAQTVPTLPGNGADDWIWVQPSSVTTRAQCQITTCTGGYVKNDNAAPTSCRTPGLGKLANANGEEADCLTGTYADDSEPE